MTLQLQLLILFKLFLHLDKLKSYNLQMMHFRMKTKPMTNLKDTHISISNKILWLEETKV